MHVNILDLQRAMAIPWIDRQIARLHAEDPTDPYGEIDALLDRRANLKHLILTGPYS